MWPFLISLALAAGSVLPPGSAVLPGSAAAAARDQCSRAVPPPWEGSWQPDVQDIEKLEAALPGALPAYRREEGEEIGIGFPDGWMRQYVGVIRDGRRLIYGNIYPGVPDPIARDPDGWRTVPFVVCDGGPTLFGVEYDVEAGTFTHFAFNGVG